MVKHNRSVLVGLLVSFLFPLTLFSAPPPKYNPATEITIEGGTQYVAEHPSRASWTGLYAIMRDGPKGEIEVHLAPAGYLAAEGLELQTGDTVTVVGSRVQWSKTEIILGREVTAKGKTVTIREKDGTPRW